jgi:drug/metabolite transporter (DMT)-like permease
LYFPSEGAKTSMPRWQADFALGIITLIWGGTFVMVKAALDAVGPATFIAFRFGIATLALLLIFRRRLMGISRKEIQAGSLIGLCLGAGYILQTIGLQYTTTGKTGFITGLTVVIVPILAAMLFRKPPGWAAVVGILVATVGLGFLTLDENLRVQPGDLWVLGGVIGFAFQIVAISHFAPKYDPIRLAVAQTAAAAVLATIAGCLFETPSAQLPLDTWGAIVFTGLIATALVFSVQTTVQSFTTPTHTALIFSLEPVFAAFFGWWWANETLGWKELIGCGLILAGILIAESITIEKHPAEAVPVASE